MATLIFLTAIPSFAGTASCSHYLRVKARKSFAVAAAMMPLAGTGFMFLPDVRRLNHDADRLKAAYVLNHRTDSKKIHSANLVIDRFYKKLEIRHPEMRLSRKEVVDALDDVYLNGVGNGFCKYVSSTNIHPKRSLASCLFSNGTLEFYKGFKEKHEASRKAKEYRDEQNTEINPEMVSGPLNGPLLVNDDLDSASSLVFSGPGQSIELCWGDERIIRFREVDQLVEFLKKEGSKK